MYEGTNNLIEQHTDAVNRLNEEIAHHKSVIVEKQTQIKHFENILADLKKLR